MDCLGDDLSGSCRYVLKMLTDPNWLARVRIFSTMLYPEAFVEGAQFSVWDLARNCVVGRELANRNPRRCLRDHTKVRYARELGRAVGWVVGEGTTSFVGAHAMTCRFQIHLLVLRSVVASCQGLPHRLQLSFPSNRFMAFEVQTGEVADDRDTCRITRRYGPARNDLQLELAHHLYRTPCVIEY